MFISKDDISNSISIKTIARNFSIRLESVSSGNFDYKCKCPSPDHKRGMERTGSCYINSKDNNFYCFGCGAGTSVVDFYMLCKDCDFSDAMRDLKLIVGEKNIRPSGRVIKPNNFNILLKISLLFKSVMRNHPNDLKWINKVMIKTDSFVQDIKTDDISSAKKLLSNLKDLVSSRYGDV